MGEGGETAKGGGRRAMRCVCVWGGCSGREGSAVVRGNITYSAGVFGTQLIKRRRVEMQKG